jgi:hypothetical protein
MTENDCNSPVGDAKQGGLRELRLDSFLNLCIRFGIHIGGSFVLYKLH